MPPVRSPIDPDDVATWPTLTRRWAETEAERLDATTIEFPGDLPISLAQEDEFRRTFGGRGLLVYHCTRLLAHEAVAIRAGGLRLLDRQLVDDRIAQAVACGALTGDARRAAESGNVYACNTQRYREARVCFVIGRTTFDADAFGCDSLLRYWGGEAIRGGAGEAPLLEGIGTPSIVVAQVDVTRPHNDPYAYPPLARVFTGALLGLGAPRSEIQHPDPVAGGQVLAIWQPGDREYDHHPMLPR